MYINNDLCKVISLNILKKSLAQLTAELNPMRLSVSQKERELSATKITIVLKRYVTTVDHYTNTVEQCCIRDFQVFYTTAELTE